MSYSLPKSLIWIDLETTGLTPLSAGAAILEVAVVATDHNFNPLDDGFTSPVYNPGTLLSPWAARQHTTSGLLADIDRMCVGEDSPPYWGDVAYKVSDYIYKHVGDTRVPMCGSSVQQFDAVWLTAAAERDKNRGGEYCDVMKHFSHRALDATSLVYAAQCACPGWVPTVNDFVAHRAEADVRRSIALASEAVSVLRGL